MYAQSSGLRTPDKNAILKEEAKCQPPHTEDNLGGADHQTSVSEGPLSWGSMKD